MAPSLVINCTDGSTVTDVRVGGPDPGLPRRPDPEGSGWIIRAVVIPILVALVVTAIKYL